MQYEFPQGSPIPEPMVARVPVAVKLLDERARAPIYANSNAVGADVFSPVSGFIRPRCYALVKMGFAVKLPDNYELQVRGRSGLAAKEGVLIHFGTIDPDYNKEIGAVIFNLGMETLDFAVGTKLCQVVIAPVLRANFHIVDDFVDSGRGGFGSTGKT
jgi:dUTP pyrophosphatase